MAASSKQSKCGEKKGGVKLDQDGSDRKYLVSSWRHQVQTEKEL